MSLLRFLDFQFGMAAKRYQFNNNSILVLFDNENPPWFKADDIVLAFNYCNNRLAVLIPLHNNYKLIYKYFTEAQNIGVGHFYWKTYFN